LFWIVVVLALATSLTVVQRVRYVARATGKASARGPSRQRDTLPGHAPALQISERTVSVAGKAGRDIAPAKGKLGVMLVGLGAVSTTFHRGRRERAAGQGAADRGRCRRWGPSVSGSAPKAQSKIKEFVPLADLQDLVFAAWDPIPDDAYTAAVKAGVLERHEHLGSATQAGAA